MKENLKNVTFNIPFKYDSQDRIDNLFFVVKYLNILFDTNINILEIGETPCGKGISDQCNYEFMIFDGMFSRSKMFNKLCKMSNTKFIVNYDCDVFFHKHQYLQSYEYLNQGYDMVLPYKDRAWNYDRNVINEIICNNKVCYDNLKNIRKRYKGRHVVGGAVFWNKDSYIKTGMDNENFNGWGCEDRERFIRSKTLKLKIKKVDGHLCHVSHQHVSENYKTGEIHRLNKRERHRIESMSYEELSEEIKKWDWWQNF